MKDEDERFLKKQCNLHYLKYTQKKYYKYGKASGKESAEPWVFRQKKKRYTTRLDAKYRRGSKTMRSTQKLT